MADAIQNMIAGMSKETLGAFCRTKSGDFVASRHSTITAQNKALFPSVFQERFASVDIIGFFKNLEIFVFLIRLKDGSVLSERSCRRLQFDFARRVLSAAHNTQYNIFTEWLGDDAPAYIDKALFVFTDANGSFRFSLVENLDRNAETPKRFRRQTFFVDRTQTNLTFKQRMGLPWNKIEQLKEAFSVEALNKEFYQKLSDWYFWAMQTVTFPETKADKESNAVPLIRLITRFIFVWFMKQKGLIPEELFKKDFIDRMIDSDKDQSSYYKAIIQNLFFATLNTEMDDQQARVFRTPNNAAGYNTQYQIHSVFRYEDFFTENGKTQFLGLAQTIPFLNGGLFSCLDTDEEVIDCFSDNSGKRAKLVVPDNLFWLREEDNKTLDLSDIYGDKKKKKELLTGLIPLLSQYNFTVDESSPNDATVALDPELLGRVFENLLASYNPETATTARKQTGSFYTPREIVDYMVEESLIQHIKTSLAKEQISLPEEDLRSLVTLDELPDSVKTQKRNIIKAIENCKILDPACGSGAFPMGLLAAFTRILEKLAPSKNDTALYTRKLKLIQNCIYGVDIQPIAIQISKLRCFISLLADDEIDESSPNRGIEPLPNLEMHFVAANSLIDINGPEAGAFISSKTEKIKDDMEATTDELFSVKKHEKKNKLQAEYMKLRNDFRESLRNDFNVHDYAKLADWDPFNQMVSSSFFNPAWMFGIKDGFDIVIGNPPYVSYGLRGVGKLTKEEMSAIKREYSNSAEYKVSLYAIFMELAIRLCKKEGVQSYIVPDSFLLGRYFSKIRSYILTNNNILNLSFFTDQVFKAIVGISVIYLFKKTDKKTEKTKIIKIDDLKRIASGNVDHIIPQTYYETTSRNRFRLYFSQREEALVKKIEKNSCPLDSYIKFASGLIGKKGQDAIKSSQRIAASWKEGIPSGAFIKKFQIERKSFFINLDPAEIKSGYDCIDYSVPKVFLRQTGDSLISALDLNGLLALNNIHIGTCVSSSIDPIKSLKVLVCLLNSNLLTWYYQTISLEKGRVMAQLDIDVIDKLPIRMPKDLSAFEKLYDDLSYNFFKFEGRLNSAVYQLYEIFDDDITIIDSSLKNISSELESINHIEAVDQNKTEKIDGDDARG